MNIKNEKIVYLKVHQSVPFEKSIVTYFTSNPGPGKAKAKMTMLTDLGCVLVEGPKDKVLIPLVNTAFIKLETEASKKKIEEKKKEAEKPKNDPKLNKIIKPK